MKLSKQLLALVAICALAVVSSLSSGSADGSIAASVGGDAGVGEDGDDVSEVSRANDDDDDILWDDDEDDCYGDSCGDDAVEAQTNPVSTLDGNIAQSTKQVAKVAQDRADVDAGYRLAKNPDALALFARMPAFQNSLESG